MATCIPYSRFQAFDNNGDYLIGGKLYTYEPSTSIDKVTYSDASLTIPNTNPVVLDARGSASVFGSGDYKLYLTDADDALIITLDGVSNINSIKCFGGSDSYITSEFIYPECYGAVGDGTTDDTDAVEAADAAGLATGLPVIYTKTYSIADDVTLSAKSKVTGSFTIATGKTLTINGPFEAGLYQVFAGAGSVKFGPGAITDIYPQWWGAEGNYNSSTHAGTDCTAAFKAAIACAEAFGDPDDPLNNFPDQYFGGVIRIPPGVYWLSDKLTITTSGVHLIGAGMGNTILYYYGGGLTTDDYLITIEPTDVGATDGPKIRPHTLEGFYLRCDNNDNGATKPRGIYLHECHDWVMKNVGIGYTHQSLADRYADYGRVVGCKFQHNWRAMYLNGALDTSFDTCIFGATYEMAIDSTTKCQVLMIATTGTSFNTCAFNSNTDGLFACITSHASNRGIAITNCYFEGNENAYALYLRGGESQGYGTTGLTFTANYVNHVTGTEYGKGILISKYSGMTAQQHGLVISGNYIDIDPTEYLITYSGGTSDMVGNSYVGQNYFNSGLGDIEILAGFNSQVINGATLRTSLTKQEVPNGSTTGVFIGQDSDAVAINYILFGKKESATTSPVKIASISGQSVFIVSGVKTSASTTSFVDVVLAIPYNAAAPTVLGTNERGSPAARTYAVSTTSLNLTMASDTYHITVQQFEGRPASLI